MVQFSMRCRKRKALCERPFALHRQQSEKDKQSVDVSPSGKFLRAPMLEVYVFQITFEITFVSHITVDMWAVGNMFISIMITL